MDDTRNASGSGAATGLAPGVARSKAGALAWMLGALVWVLLAGSLAAWAWCLARGVPVAPGAVAQAAVPPPGDAGRVKQLLGASADRPPARLPTPRPKLLLTGVIGNGQQGHVALLGVEDQPSRPFLVGLEVVQGYVLKAVDTRQAVLSTPEGEDWALPMPEVSASQGASAAAPRAGRRRER